MKWSFNALGTTWWIELFEDLDDQTRHSVKDAVSGLVNTFESNYSRFRADSYVSALNKQRVLHNPDPELIELLTCGKHLYLRTDAVFNFLTGHLLESKGYDAAYSFIGTYTDQQAGNPITDLQITHDKIELLHGNIDLGGYGKGYLIDRLAEACTEIGIHQFLINGGGDMYATHNQSEAVEIYLEHPTKPGVFVGTTSLYNQGFAASSPHKRVWKNKTGTHHHIIGETITYDATYVKAATAYEADAFATTLLQLTPAQTSKLLQTEAIAVAQLNTQTQILEFSKQF